jgi:hypothetical protein
MAQVNSFSGLVVSSVKSDDRSTVATTAVGAAAIATAAACLAIICSGSATSSALPCGDSCAAAFVLSVSADIVALESGLACEL